MCEVRSGRPPFRISRDIRQIKGFMDDCSSIECEAPLCPLTPKFAKSQLAAGLWRKHRYQINPRDEFLQIDLATRTAEMIMKGVSRYAWQYKWEDGRRAPPPTFHTLIYRALNQRQFFTNEDFLFKRQLDRKSWDFKLRYSIDENLISKERNPSIKPEYIGMVREYMAKREEEIPNLNSWVPKTLLGPTASTHKRSPVSSIRKIKELYDRGRRYTTLSGLLYQNINYMTGWTHHASILY